MGTVTAPMSAEEAMDMVHAGLGFLAATDPTAMTTGEHARYLRGLERADAICTAARASVLGGFTAARGYCADADYSPRTWLMHKTGITRGAAAAHTAWAERAAGHRLVLAAMAAGEISESYGKAICGWTDRLPENCREAADEILLAAAAAGMSLRDLIELAAEIYERSRPDRPDEDPADGFDDRAVRLETTFGGAGVLHGDLTPECAADTMGADDGTSGQEGNGQAAGPDTTRAWAALERAVMGKAT
jgi:hypothetical protein